jgi:hypothetical protein
MPTCYLIVCFINKLCIYFNKTTSQEKNLLWSGSGLRRFRTRIPIKIRSESARIRNTVYKILQNNALLGKIEKTDPS